MVAQFGVRAQVSLFRMVKEMPLYDYTCTICGQVKEENNSVDKRDSPSICTCGGKRKRSEISCPVRLSKNSVNINIPETDNSSPSSVGFKIDGNAHLENCRSIGCDYGIEIGPEAKVTTKNCHFNGSIGGVRTRR